MVFAASKSRTGGVGRVALAIGLSLCAASALAQRVQFPSSTAPPTTGPPPTFADWGTPTYSAPPTAPVTPGLSAPGFDPYSASGAPLGPPPSSLPYSYAAPNTAYPAPVAPSYDAYAPPPSAGLYPEGNSLGWQPGTYGYEQDDGSVVRFRRLVARLRFEHTLLLGDSSADAFEVNRTEIASTFAFPIAGSIDTPLLITPGFAFNWFHGPQADPTAMPREPDMPPRVYDAYLDFSMYPQWTPELGAELGVRTGVWTDFEEVNDDSVRVLGRGLGVISVTPTFDFLIGAVYLDRLRVKVLPAGGVRWRPSPQWDLYLVFPNPKIRRTFFSNGTADWWWYVAGEYGGGSWTLERAGLGDRVDYNDLRVVWGIEWQTPGQANGHLEIGYVFDRELIFGDSGMPDRAKLDDAVMFRAGIGF